MNKIGRNSKCICGSGKKYKVCCINKNHVDIKPVIKDEWYKFKSLETTFEGILDELKNDYLMADILEISATKDRDILFDEFNKQFGSIFNTEQEERGLRLELFNKVEEYQKKNGENNLNLYKGIYVIENISDYIQVLSIVKKIEGEKELWYRGQQDSRFNLIPNIHRCAKEIGTAYGNEVKPKKVSCSRRGQEVTYPNIKRMLEEFKEELKDQVKFEVNNDFEWMFLGQHYGLLTPLLDWSEDPLVGLFFAIDGLVYEGNEGRDEEIEEFKKFNRISNSAAVYILDPSEFNKNGPFYHTDENDKMVFVDYPVKITDNNIEVFRGYIDGGQWFPLCIKAPKREYRICRQSGNFVCMGSNIQPIDSYQICNKFLYKIYIPYSAVKNIKRELEILNITSSAIYGENSVFSDSAKVIRKKEEVNFSNMINRLNQKYSRENLES